ncbi:MAG: hypothetical protein DRI48_00870 [Chloroflexi bacterium]|nr:MAG: hypothetical protein DRI48_00870 [Chloroflexota bacterium]
MKGRSFYIAALFLGLFLTTLVALGRTTPTDDCTPIYQDVAWTISTCPDDPSVPATMTVWLNGTEQPDLAARLEFAHLTADGVSRPTVAVLYSSAFVRLKQNADPAPAIPFGTSVVLGPAYWAGGVYHHSPTLDNVSITTDWLPSGPLRLAISGTNADFEVGYEVTLPSPSDELTRWHVAQYYTATAPISLDSGRLDSHEGFRLAQFSSMFINQSGSCGGGDGGCHDSDGARYIAADGTRRQVAFADVDGGWMFSSTATLGDVWLDALHSDDQSWQGNTPNLRLALDAVPEAGTVTPQGWISPTADPDQDNVGLWLHDDSVTAWSAGQSDSVGYWILAQDDPPEPWAELGLRTGLTFLDFEGSADCFFVHDPGQETTGSVYTIAGYTDTALELSYDLGSANHNWAQVRCDFEPPLDLSAYDHLRFDWRGDPEAANSLEVGLIDQAGTVQRIFARGYHHDTHRGCWGQLVIPFNFLPPWTTATTFDSTHVVAFMLSVVNDGDDVGGAGRIAIDNLNAYNVVSRTIATDFSTPVTNTTATARAVQWLASQQQQTTGLLKSWAEESTCTAHIYDQALALIVFSHEGLWPQADAIVTSLGQAQNADGTWYKSYDCNNGNLPCVHCHKWEGDIAWAIYALSRYQVQGGALPQTGAVMDQAASWLTDRVAPDGCLEIDHTEGTIDAWWALQVAGPNYRDEAKQLKDCLLTEYWDEKMGRFKGGRDWRQPYLDNQTWGAAFLRAIGREEDARRALSYAYETLRLPARGGQLFGFDGQAGPWAVWNEGTEQYVAAGGAEADDFARELVSQQRRDGAQSGSPDNFAGGGVWTTRWHGIAPTAWLYFALTPGEPFPEEHRVWLPLVLRNHLE